MSTATLLPPLRAGEHIKCEEFLRRWEAMPELKHAELIGGIVHMPSPVSIAHSDFHAPLSVWLGYYAAFTPGCRVGIDGTWLMSDEDAPQPDLALRILAEYGGQARQDGTYSAGAPELIVEVSYSSAADDLGQKLQLYERSGVREYITALIERQQVIWRELADGQYREIAPDAGGMLCSRLFPGLWLDEKALWSLDAQRLLAGVQRGLASPEHTAFVRDLDARGQRENRH